MHMSTVLLEACHVCEPQTFQHLLHALHTIHRDAHAGVGAVQHGLMEVMPSCLPLIVACITWLARKPHQPVHTLFAQPYAWMYTGSHENHNIAPAQVSSNADQSTAQGAIAGFDIGLTCVGAIGDAIGVVIRLTLHVWLSLSFPGVECHYNIVHSLNFQISVLRRHHLCRLIQSLQYRNSPSVAMDYAADTGAWGVRAIPPTVLCGTVTGRQFMLLPGQEHAASAQETRLHSGDGRQPLGAYARMALRHCDRLPMQPAKPTSKPKTISRAMPKLLIRTGLRCRGCFRYFSNCLKIKTMHTVCAPPPATVKLPRTRAWMRRSNIPYEVCAKSGSYSDWVWLASLQCRFLLRERGCIVSAKDVLGTQPKGIQCNACTSMSRVKACVLCCCFCKTCLELWFTKCCWMTCYRRHMLVCSSGAAHPDLPQLACLVEQGTWITKAPWWLCTVIWSNATPEDLHLLRDDAVYAGWRMNCCQLMRLSLRRSCMDTFEMTKAKLGAACCIHMSWMLSGCQCNISKLPGAALTLWAAILSTSCEWRSCSVQAWGRYNDYSRGLLDPHKFWRRRPRRWLLRTCLGCFWITWPFHGLDVKPCQLSNMFVHMSTVLLEACHVCEPQTFQHLLRALHTIHRGAHAGVGAVQHGLMEMMPSCEPLIVACIIWLARKPHQPAHKLFAQPYAWMHMGSHENHNIAPAQVSPNADQSTVPGAIAGFDIGLTCVGAIGDAIGVVIRLTLHVWLSLSFPGVECHYNIVNSLSFTISVLRRHHLCRLIQSLQYRNSPSVAMDYAADTGVRGERAIPPTVLCGTVTGRQFMLLPDQEHAASAQETRLHSGDGGQSLGTYARMALRHCDRLPMRPAKPTSKPKTISRAMPKLLIRTGLRCRCCFRYFSNCLKIKTMHTVCAPPPATIHLACMSSGLSTPDCQQVPPCQRWRIRLEHGVSLMTRCIVLFCTPGALLLVKACENMAPDMHWEPAVLPGYFHAPHKRGDQSSALPLCRIPNHLMCHLQCFGKNLPSQWSHVLWTKCGLCKHHQCTCRPVGLQPFLCSISVVSPSYHAGRCPHHCAPMHEAGHLLLLLLYFIDLCVCRQARHAAKLVDESVSSAFGSHRTMTQHAPTPTSGSSPLGPKSEGGRQCMSSPSWILRSQTWLLALFILLCIQPVSGVRVAADSTPAAGANSQLDPNRPLHMEAKPGGNFDTLTQPVFSHARKRAYKRAVLRAQRDGCTFYRGRRVTLRQLTGDDRPPTTGHAHAVAGPRSKGVRPQNTLDVLSWNVGGLSNAILDELLIWLSLPQHRNIRIVMLQETRWQFSSEWENDNWYLVHSGHSKQKGAGVLTMISKALCHASDIRSRILASGRVLHVRIPSPKGDTCIDVVNVYQHAWDQRAEVAPLTAKRSYVLEQVDSCLQQMPWRNLCICAGDWNAQLAPMTGQVGNSTRCSDPSQQSAPDAPALVDLLIARQLVALNTWSGSRRHAFTYENQGRKTQIDYVFVRRHQSTPGMRRCTAISDFPVTAWRQTGLHRPLLLKADYAWCPTRPRPGRGIDRDAMANAALAQSPLITTYKNDVRVAVSQDPSVDVASLHRILYDCSLKHFPSAPVRKEYAYQTETVRTVVHGRWHHLRQGKHFRQQAASCLASAWRCWFHFARFRAMRREANRASRVARKLRYDRLLAEAESDASCCNIHRLYAVIRQIAPKQPFRRVKIYGTHGEVLDRAAEAERLKLHFANLFQDECSDCKHAGTYNVSLPSSEDVEWALAKTPLRKAVPKHMAPGVAWRAAADVVTPLVHAAVCKAWSSGVLPQPWKDGWLVLMQKPQKPGRDPGDYRPLCLQDPCGKAMIRLMAERIRPLIRSYASRCPQYAYLAGRSTEGALLNVFSRCKQIRQVTQCSGYSVFTRRAGEVTTPYTGGLILSLDLSAAFDSVPRLYIKNSLLAAGVSDSDAQIIMAWLDGSNYHLQHAQIDIRVRTDKGVRQGCVLSPLLWTCFTCFVVYGLEDILDIQDLQVYADDFLWSRIFHTKEQFLDTLRTVPKFLTRLEEYGLKVNLTKTAALVRMARHEGKSLLKQHVCRKSKQQYLCFLSATPIRIPIKKAHVYMGCVISLYDFEGATIRHRITIARYQFSRLRSVLTSSRCLSLKQRARIWRACIWSTLMYGWTCCGGTAYTVQMVIQLAHTQLRQVAKSPRHIMHTTNEEVGLMLGLPSPAVLIQQSVNNFLQRLSHLEHLPGDDVMRRLELHTQAGWAVEQISTAISSCGRLERVTLTEGVPCPVCGVYFASVTAMRKHKSRRHKDAEPEVPIVAEQVQREQHCIDGMPVCRGCGKTFHHMQGLMRHIKKRRCHGMSESAKPVVSVFEPLPIAKQGNLLESWHAGGIPSLKTYIGANPDLRKELLHHCCICRQWTSDHRSIKTHIKKAHPTLYSECHELALVDCKVLSGEVMNPCAFCEQSVTNRNRHVGSCPVLYQVALSCRIYGRTLQREYRLSLRGHSPCSWPADGRSEAPGDTTDVKTNVGQSSGPPGEVPEAGQAQGRRQRQRQGQEKARSIRSFFGKSAGQSVDTPDGAIVPPARGLHQHSPHGQSICDDVSHERRRDDASYPEGLGGPMAGAKGFGEDGMRKADCVVEGSTPGTADARQGHAGEGGQDTAADQTGLDDEAGRQGADVAAPGLECPDAEGYPLSGSRPPPAQSGNEVSGDGSGACQQPGSATLPLYAPTGKRVLRRHYGLPPGNQSAGSSAASGSRCSQSTLQFSTVVSDRSPPENGKPQAFIGGQQVAADPSQRVLSLVLRNSGNLCYQNAFVMSWIWAILRANAQADDDQHGDRLGRGAALIQALLSGLHYRLAGVFAWTPILLDWPRPQLQHDVAAFASHALPRLRSALMSGLWLAKREDPHCRTVDEGPLHMPLPIPIPDGACTLQECVDAWHQQDALHALGNASPLILIQLGRFRHRSHRHVRKYQGLLLLDELVFIPIFEEGLRTQLQSYKPISGVFHIGNTPASGHYRAFLCEADNAGADEIPEHQGTLDNAYVTDDGIIPQKLERRDHDLILTNAYLVWLMRV